MAKNMEVYPYSLTDQVDNSVYICGLVDQDVDTREATVQSVVSLMESLVAYSTHKINCGNMFAEKL